LPGRIIKERTMGQAIQQGRKKECKPLPQEPPGRRTRAGIEAYYRSEHSLEMTLRRQYPQHYSKRGRLLKLVPRIKVWTVRGKW